MATTPLAPAQEEILDALWLAARLPTGAAAPILRVRAATGAPEPADPVPPTAAGGRLQPPSSAKPSTADPLGLFATGPEEEAPHRPATENGPTASTTAPPAPGGEPDRANRHRHAPAISAPAPRAIPDALALGRALRPLKRHTPSTSRYELNEAATVEAIAETRLIQGVLRPQQEPWLRLALVVEENAVMQLWEHQVDSLSGLLERTGAFRTIDRYGLRWSERERRPIVTRRHGALDAAPLAPGNLVPAASRTMVLVVSDGSSALWSHDRAKPLLRTWASRGPTAIVHTLPRRLWPGSGITTTAWQAAAPAAGEPNSTWRTSDPVLPPEVARFEDMAVPVLALTPTALSAWVRTITVPGRPTVLNLWSGSTDGAGPADRNPNAQLAHFLRSASPEARQLAAHVAARGTVTMAVMQLINSYVNPGAGGSANTVALAEVVLGAPLRRPPNCAPASDLPGLPFSIAPEAIDTLLQLVPLNELVACNEHVSCELERLAGRSAHFPVWLRPAGSGDPMPFALLSNPLRRALGLPPTAEADHPLPPGIAADPTGDPFVEEVRTLLVLEQGIDLRRPDAAAESRRLASRHSSVRTWARICEVTRSLFFAEPDRFGRGLAWALAEYGARLALDGQPEQALAAANEGVEILRDLAPDAEHQLSVRFLEALLVLGQRYRALGENDSALAADLEALDVHRGLDPTALTGLDELAEAHLGRTAESLGRRELAESDIATAADSVARLRSLPADGRPVPEPGLAAALNELAAAYARADRTDDALVNAEESVALYRQLAEAGTPEPKGHADALRTLSLALADSQRLTRAIAAVEARIEILRGLGTDGAAHLLDLADALDDLALQLTEVGRTTEALPAAEESVALGRTVVGEDLASRRALAWSMDTLGSCLRLLSRHEEAVALGQECIAMARGLVAAGDDARVPFLADQLLNTGLQTERLGRDSEALTLVQESVAVLRESADDDPAVKDLMVGRAMRQLCRLLSKAERHSESAAVAEEQVALLRSRVAAEQPGALQDLVEAVDRLAFELSFVDDAPPDRAMTLAREAVELSRQLAVPRLLSETLGTLGLLLLQAEEREEGLAVSEERVALLRQLADEDPEQFRPVLAIALDDLADWLSQTEQRNEAVATAHEAVVLTRSLVTDAPQSTLDLAGALRTLGRRLAEVSNTTEATAVIEERITLLRRLNAEDTRHRGTLADALDDLAIRLGQDDRPDEALAAAQESVALYRQAANEDAGQVPGLAWALGTLGRRLNQVGQLDGALLAAEERVRLLRRLFEEDPDEYRTDLADALEGSAALLEESSHTEEAIADSVEALELLRRQAAVQDNAATRARYTQSLGTLSRRLSRADRHEEATVLAEERTRLLRDLAASAPATHLPALADAAGDLAMRLSLEDRAEESEHAAQEAVDIARRLAVDDPAQLPLLARWLRVHSLSLSQADRPDEALEASQERVNVLRPLAERDPVVHLPDLANALDYLAVRLGQAGRPDEGVAAAEEAVAISRQLVGTDATAHTEGLVRALRALARRLSQVDRTEEAVPADEERIALLRRLTEQDPARHRPDLADALDDLALHSLMLNRNAQAVDAAGEAVTHYRALAEADPAGHELNLLWTLRTLTRSLAGAARTEEVVAVDEERIALLRRLTEQDPARHRPDLADALDDLALHLSDTDRLPSAVDAAREAVAINRALAATDPAHADQLAWTLATLSMTLFMSGSLDESSAAAEERVAILRTATEQLGPDNPDADRKRRLIEALTALVRVRMTLPGQEDRITAAAREAIALSRTRPNTADQRGLGRFVHALGSLADVLADAGRYDEAAEVGRDLVELLRIPAERAPGRFLVPFVNALRQLSSSLLQLGDSAESITLCQQAVAILDGLADSGSPFFDAALLADTLDDLAIRLITTDPPASVAAAERSVGLFRTLAREDPRSHEAALAWALRTLAHRLAEAGRPEEALPVHEERAALLSRLAAADPDQHNEALAHSLNDLAHQLAEHERPEEALDAIRRATGIQRLLAAADPGLHEVDLAEALGNTALIHSSLDHHDTARQHIEEAVAMLRRLTATDPDQHKPVLARVLGVLVVVLESSDDHAAAVAPAQERVALLRLLTEEDDRFAPELTESLQDLSNVLARNDPS
ncbi:SAV_2336 N-terminal domain-related protein [Streptomyces sp. XY431]|uniref:SAV_2336 N-terminal domain-related protein n=1 Tax=Streptomyces sp. XY431 TaxID=1415562 RepID=UPI0006B0181D|nr:SAV_2336 N-terminal domain-related protein [Streptomyces sp. XY431]